MQDLIAKIDAFVAERDWDRYHAPKNLAMDEDQSRKLDKAARDHLHDEIGDVLIYLTMLARKLGIDPLGAAHAKLEKNAVKYPAVNSGAKILHGRP